MSTRLPVLANDLGTKGGCHDMYSAWSYLRKGVLATCLQSLVWVVSCLMIVQLVDVLLLWLGRGLISITGYKCPLVPEEDDVGNGKGKGDEPLLDGSLISEERKLLHNLIGNGICENGQHHGEEGVRTGVEEWHPKVLIQIPMCNERECYQQSMMAICGMDWPWDQLLIQVLDDSDIPEIQRMISSEVEAWKSRGAPIVYLHRTARVGHKAGNLKFGMEAVGPELRECKFVAIFDADFMPPRDFLRRTVPYFYGRPDLALVQARWIFVNAKQNLITRLQDIAECYHFEIEQQVMSWYSYFFGFNGTAGVWRTEALESGGGWEHRTTVEDMDIAVRAHLQGWRFIFLNEVRTMCELPSTYASYCKQQHRWYAGPMQLFRLTLWQTISASGVPLWKKVNLIIVFFWLRKLLLPLLTFLIVFVLVPASVIVPELEVPLWLALGSPLTLSALHLAAATEDGWQWCLLLFPNMLFENLMALTKACAITAGLLGTKSMGEWVVTQKSGAPVQVVRALSFSLGRPKDSSMSAATAMHKDKDKEGLDNNAQRLLQGDYVPLPDSKSKTFTCPQAWDRDRDSRGGASGDVEERPARSAISALFAWPRSQRPSGIHMRELILGMAMIALALWSFHFGDGRYSVFIGFQGAMLLAAGLNLLGDWWCL